MHGIANKNVVFVLLLTLILVMNVGGAFSSEMMMGESGTMHNCPFMGMAAICEMSPLVHLSEWQKMFTATAQQMTSVALLLLLVLVVALPQFLVDVFLPKRIERYVPRYRCREKVFDPLRLAFARGIIHSKSF